MESSEWWVYIGVVKGPTVQRVPATSAVLVGLEAVLVERCRDVLQGAGLKVLSAGHVAAACERIPIVMPQLVIARVVLPTVEADMLYDSCVAVGADLMRIGLDIDPAELTARLKSAAGIAKIRAMESK